MLKSHLIDNICIQISVFIGFIKTQIDLNFFAIYQLIVKIKTQNLLSPNNLIFILYLSLSPVQSLLSPGFTINVS